ncbi:MAG: MarR family winged helix-turn-helix transcriptional regulator [Actinomycetota bacterium]
MTDSTHFPEGIPTKVRLGDQLCFALYAATNAVTRTYRPLLDDIGITYPQYLVLLVLWEHRRETIGGIGNHLHLPAHAISPIIDRLEARGLVERSTDPDDARRVLVELTSTGSELETRAAAAWHEVRCRTLMNQSELSEMRTQLLNLIDRMTPP